jgi:hypothetical protein
MSNLRIATTNDRFSGRSLLRSAAWRIGSCPLTLMAALFAASCGLVGQNSQNNAILDGLAAVIASGKLPKARRHHGYVNHHGFLRIEPHRKVERFG